jgi:hypothetical protein
MSRAMSAQWNSIRNELTRYIQSDEAARAFARAQQAQELLRAFDFPTIAIEFLDSDVASEETSDAVVTSLIKLAQAGTERRIAYAVLWLGLWRSLTSTYRHRMKIFSSRSELASAVSAHFHHQVNRLNLNRVNKVAATLIRNTARDVCRERSRCWKEDKRRVDMDVDDAIIEYYPHLLRKDDDHVVVDSRRALCSLADRPDHDLVLTVVVSGEPSKEAAVAAGISDEAVRKRVQRTLARVRRDLADPVPNGVIGQTRATDARSLIRARDTQKMAVGCPA